MKNKKIYQILPIILLVSLSLLASLPQSADATTLAQTRYFSGRLLNVYKGGSTWRSLYQAKVGTSGLATWKTYSDTTGDLTLYTGVRIWRRDANGTETQLTSAVSAIVSLNGLDTDYSSFYLLSKTWTLANNVTTAKTDILVFYVYSSIDNSTWALMTVNFISQWNTESLLATTFVASTWTFFYEISYQWDGVTTLHIFSCWAIGYASSDQPRIEGIKLDDGVTSTVEDITPMAPFFFFGILVTAVIGTVIFLGTSHRHH